MAALRICNRCGWAHFPRSRAEVETEARKFGEYLAQQTPEQQKAFGYGPLSKAQRAWDFTAAVGSSERCFHCGNPHTAFHDATPEEEARIPIGCTLQGIIKEQV